MSTSIIVCFGEKENYLLNVTLIGDWEYDHGGLIAVYTSYDK